MHTHPKKSIVIVITLLTLGTAFPTDAQLPYGWRTPTNGELQDDWRNDDDSRYSTVQGDFNGDGIMDVAKIVVRKDGSGFGLYVFLSQRDHSVKTYQLDETNDIALLADMGITRVQPGTYRTACGKGYWSCQKEEVPEITIGNDAIDYFKSGSANCYFYWDSKSSSFKRIWISD